MLTSYRVWGPAVCWLSKNWIVARHEREASGATARVLLVEAVRRRDPRRALHFAVRIRRRRRGSGLAYAEERIRAAASRSRCPTRLARSLIGLAMPCRPMMQRQHSNSVRRPCLRRSAPAFLARADRDIDDLGAGLAVLLTQYQQFENRSLAVRGDRLCLAWSRWQDGPAGNEAIHHTS